MLPVQVHYSKPPRTELTPGVHYLPQTGSQPAIVVKSSDTSIDLSAFELVGNRLPDQEHYAGVGILFDHCKNLVVKNGKVHGYRINVILRGCENVRIDGMKADMSHADVIRTFSGQIVDKFLNVRNLAEWPNYGAGIWMHDCNHCRLVHCSAHHAMNGAVLVTSNACTITNCDFSYNSGWGLALWQSGENLLTWNHLDFCNRPWSGGWGGDAAGMVLVTGSNDNVIVGNSMTHGGDGLFLADRVEGGWSEKDQKFHYQDGCSKNVIWDNDGSWASANAFEATFSRDNQFGENKASDSSYGFWLGYSSHSLLVANHVDQNDHDGVAIEHGQGNRILSNVFDSDQEAAIHLWSSSGPKDVESPSVDNVVAYNVIENCGTLVDLKGSTKTFILPADLVTKQDSSVTGASDQDIHWTIPAIVTQILDTKPPQWLNYRDSGGPVGQAWIQAGIYSPTPFLSFGSVPVNDTTYKLWFTQAPTRLKGPKWITFKPGQDPRYVSATSSFTDGDGSEQSALIQFSLPGSPTASLGGAKVNQMTLHFRSGAWDCRWFKWKDLAYDDRKAWLDLFNSPPLAEQKLPVLNGDFSNTSPVPGVVPPDHYALAATRRFTFASGIYRFNTLSDDGIRLFIDGREVISRWDHHPTGTNSVQLPLTPGPHDLRVEYFQEDGDAQLKVDWKKVQSTT